MKCPNCGADLLDDSIFCRDCGIKLPPPKRRCKYCGAELEEGAKCCTNCGQRIEPPVITRAVSEGTRQATTGDAVRQNVPGYTQVGNQSRPTQSDGKNTQFAQIWNKMDLFFKCIAIFGAVLFLVFLGAAFAHKTAAMIIALLQICGLVVVVLMHKEYIVTQYSWLKYVIATGCLLLSALLILSFSWGTNAKKKSSSSVYQSATQPPEGRASSALVATAQPVKTTRPTKKPSSTSTPRPTQKSSSAPRPTAKPTPVPSPTDVPTAAPEDINFAIEVDFVQNLIFSQYNVDLYLDDNYIDTLIHGKYYVSLHKISAGRHTISFKEVGGSNSGSTYFTIEKDSTFVCHIKATSSGVEIYNNYISGTMDGIMATMPNTVGLLYSEALTELTQRGFGNISYKTIGNHIIWDNDNWLVLEQSVAVDAEIQKSESIELTCISLNDYFKDTYVGKNVNDIQQLANDAGFSIRFEISSGSSMDSDIKSMSKKTKAEWVATDARQYGGADRTAVVTITFTGTPTPTPKETASSSDAKGTPKTTKKPTSAINHSSNNREVAKKGDSGVYAYRSKGGEYYIYIIIDFDEGYVYRFNDGNGDKWCDKVKIDSGDLNQGLQITYHDGGQVWSNWLHFKWKNQPDMLILLDNDYFEWTFYETNLSTALSIKYKKNITDY